MKKILLVVLLFIAMIAPPAMITLQNAFVKADPMVGLGYLFDVDPYDPDAPKDFIVQGVIDSTGKWKVNPGVSYLITLREVEYDHARVSVHGSNMDGTEWIVDLGQLTASGAEASGRGWYYWFRVPIPESAGCTSTVHYRQGPDDTSGNPNSETHIAAQRAATSWVPGSHDPNQQKGGNGKLKAYYPGGNGVPCAAPGVPEFPFVSAVAVSLGLGGALLVRRRQKRI